MQNLWGITSLIIGSLAMVFLFVQSMISIDKNLRDRQSKTKEFKSFKYRLEIYSTRSV